MNLFIFTGNLGKDAEIRTTQSGTNVMTFSVAVKSGYGDNAKTNWINCAMFGKRTEGELINYLKKGTQVAISGEYELKEWQGQDGTQNKMPSVRVGELDLIGGKPDSGQAPQHNQQQYQPQQGGFQQAQAPSHQNAPTNTGGFSQPAAGGFDDFSDDVPF